MVVLGLEELGRAVEVAVPAQEEQRKKDFIKTLEAIGATGLFSPEELETLIHTKIRPRNSQG